MADDTKKPEPEEAVLAKSIKDIPAGRLSSGTESWDYSHLLKPEQQAVDMRLRVRYELHRNVIYATVHRGDQPAIGGVMGVILSNGKTIEPHAYLALPDEMKGKGLGRSMYEAVYAHAYKKHGIRKVQGGYHTADARRVHERLAQKHGLKYNPEPGFPTESATGFRGGPYEYMLKGDSDSMPACPKCGAKDVKVALIGEPVYECQECGKHWEFPFEKSPGPENSDIGTELSAGTIVTKEMVKNQSFATGAMMKHPAFRHLRTGEVVESPGFHDIHHLAEHLGYGVAAMEQDDPQIPELNDWEHGFVDHAGRFYSRKEAAQVVGAPPPEGGGPGELESADYRGGQMEGLYKAERRGLLKGPAFRHNDSGEVFETPVYHDYRHLASQFYRGKPPFDLEGDDYPDEFFDWFTAGFVDHKGKFYDRAQALAAVSTPKARPEFVRGSGEEPGNLESTVYRQGVRQGLFKSESFPKSPRWVKHPELPARIQRIFDAVRSNLTPDLLQAQYAGGAHPLSGHCFVATQALYHLLDGKRTGWERAHVKVADDTHWFLRHKKTGVILDPTAEQFSARPPYEKATARPGPVGPPDYDPEKPTQRAQALIDRVKPGLKKAEEEGELQELVKTVGYVTFPKLGATTVQEPMTYPKGSGFAGTGKKGRAIFGARYQLASDPYSTGAVEGGYKGEERRRVGRIEHDAAKRRGAGFWGSGIEGTGKGLPVPGPERVATGIAMGGKVHGVVGTRAHEAQHSVFSQLAQKYGNEARLNAIRRVISKLHPEGIAAGKRVMGTSGYSLGLDPEEFITSHQQFLTDEKSRNSIYKMLSINDPEEQRAFFKLMRRNFEQMRQAAALVSTRQLKVPKLCSKKMRKSELAKSISAIPQGAVLAHNPQTNESLHDYSHVLPQQLRAEGWKLRIHHVPRVQSMVARVYDPAGKAQGSLSTFHNIEQGEPVLGIDTAGVNSVHRGKGLGLALYEGSYAFGRHRLGLKKVVGGEHTDAADRVHVALARKHGLSYEPSSYSRREGADAEGMFGPYEYLIKEEVGFRPREGGDREHEFVKSEDWSPADWEEYGQVLEKAARAGPGQLGLPGIGEEVVAPEDRAAREAAIEAERQRLIASGQLPRHIWGATWHERAGKGQLYPEEVDDFVRRITQPVPHPLGERGQFVPIWDEVANEERPALTVVNVRHFLDTHWDKLMPEQRSTLVASPYVAVSSWTHANHNKLSDEEFKHIVPTIASNHFWGEKGRLPEHRIRMMLDYAKSIPRPRGEAPSNLDSYEAREPWLNWIIPWTNMNIVAQYTPMSDELSWKLLQEMPKNHPDYERMLYHVADSPALSEEHRAMLMDAAEGQKFSQLADRSVGQALLSHARDPQLQRRAADFLIRHTQHHALGQGLMGNPQLDPSVVKLVMEHGPHTALQAALRNPNFPTEMLPALAGAKAGTTRGHYAGGSKAARELRIAVANHPAADEELLRELEKDRHGTVRNAARKALAWHDPSSVHDEHVDVRFNTGKLRQIRDRIIASDKESLPPKELPPGDWKAVRDEHGNVSAKKIDEFIEKQPAVKYGVSEGMWRGMQRHSREPSYVFQLNLSTDQVKKLKEAGVYETFRRMHNASTSSAHPVGHAGIGWVRWTGNEKGIHVDEVQSDLGQSFVKQAANLARRAGQNPDEATSRAQDEYPEEHYQKIKDIVFGGKHPSEVLTEAFLQHLRTEKKPDKTGYNRYTGTTFQFGGRKSYVGVPIHIWTPQSKATISLRHSSDDPLPGHFQVGYRDVPQKRLGMKPGKYGDIPTQTSRKHEGKATWTDELRKREPGAYVILGKVED